jgi:predicted NBD/HSP70 family sugar kinase
MSLSLPGFWDKNGVLQESFFLENYIGYPLIQELASSLGIKEYTWESDVICGALGEHYFGIGNGRDHSLLYINLGTGIGAVLIKDGKPFKQANNLTLRMQKLVFPYGDQLCSAVDLISGGMLLDFAEYDSIEELYIAYKEGDIKAIDTSSRAQTQLAAWLINLFYLFAPDVIVLNGGLTFDFEVLAEAAVEIANEELEGKIEIVHSKLKELAPIYGAYLNSMQRIVHSV